MYSNYKRENRFLGIIDYKSLWFCVIYSFVIFVICGFLPIKLEYAIYVFIFMVVPVIAIFCVNINNESAVDVILTIFEFIFKSKIYVRKDYICDFKSVIYKKINEKYRQSLARNKKIV